MTQTTEDTATFGIRARFGRNVKAERARRGWTQEELADRAGITEAYVGRVERGEASPSITTAHLLAGALDVSIAILFGEDA